MILSITNTRKPATDLGYLLHKHPDKLQSVDISHGKAHVFYPEANNDVCTASLIIDIDPIDLIRNAGNAALDSFTLGQYVNDRPYVASSFLSVALVKAFSTAMNGRCKDKPELVDQKLPLKVEIPVLPAPQGGEALIRKLFEPLGYHVEVTRHTLDAKFPEWGDSRYYSLILSNEIALKELLTHLYVLIPAMDNDKHYWISNEEVEKLMQKGAGWLNNHHEKELIVKRYLKNIGVLAKDALRKLVDDEDIEQSDENGKKAVQFESLNQTRLKAVFEELKNCGAQRVLDLGCGEGKLLRMLLKERQFEFMLGMDVSYRTLEIAHERLNIKEMPPKQKSRIELIQGSLTYIDKRLMGFDAAAIVEVIEHLDLGRLLSFEKILFEVTRPKTIIVTTPNVEYNVKYETLEKGNLRFHDHQFEWTRKEFQDWGNGLAQKNNYSVEFKPIGEEDEKVGAPTQMAIFKSVE